eukprot:sb/3475938/
MKPFVFYPYISPIQSFHGSHPVSLSLYIFLCISFSVSLSLFFPLDIYFKEIFLCGPPSPYTTLSAPLTEVYESGAFVLQPLSPAPFKSPHLAESVPILSPSLSLYLNLAGHHLFTSTPLLQ